MRRNTNKKKTKHLQREHEENRHGDIRLARLRVVKCHYRKFFHKIVAKIKIVRSVARRGFPREKLIQKIHCLKGRHYRGFFHKIFMEARIVRRVARRRIFT